MRLYSRTGGKLSVQSGFSLEQDVYDFLPKSFTQPLASASLAALRKGIRKDVSFTLSPVSSPFSRAFSLHLPPAPEFSSRKENAYPVSKAKGPFQKRGPFPHASFISGSGGRLTPTTKFMHRQLSCKRRSRSAHRLSSNF